MNNIISVPKKVILFFSAIVIFTISTQANDYRNPDKRLYGTWKPVSFINNWDELEEASDCVKLSRFTFYKDGDLYKKDAWEGSFGDDECHEEFTEGSWEYLGSSRYVLKTPDETLGRKFVSKQEVRIKFRDKNTMTLDLFLENGGTQELHLSRVR